LKDNIALIAVLEAKFGNQGTENPGKRQLLCVVCRSSFSLDVYKVGLSLVRYHTMCHGILLWKKSTFGPSIIATVLTNTLNFNTTNLATKELKTLVKDSSFVLYVNHLFSLDVYKVGLSLVRYQCYVVPWHSFMEKVYIWSLNYYHVFKLYPQLKYCLVCSIGHSITFKLGLEAGFMSSICN
jgi:hypothetical protein